jgi:hypothetical protein
MGMYGALAVSLAGGGIPQDLDLDTMELFTHFFSTEELISNLHFLDLSVRELTILKAALLQELARQIAQQRPLRDAVRDRCQLVYTAISASGSRGR